MVAVVIIQLKIMIVISILELFSKCFAFKISTVHQIRISSVKIVNCILFSSSEKKNQGYASLRETEKPWFHWVKDPFFF